MSEFSSGGSDGIPRNPNVILLPEKTETEGFMSGAEKVESEQISEEEFQAARQKSAEESRPDVIIMEGGEVVGFEKKDPNVGENGDKQAGERYNDDMGKENPFNNGGSGNGGNGGGRGPENNHNPENDPRSKVERVRQVLVDSNFLRPDEVQEQEMSEKLKKIGSILGHEFKGVEDINNRINNPNASEIQKKNAEEDKRILGEAAFLATEELTRDNPELKMNLFMGSKHVDNMLPEELKGLGKNISEKYISNAEIDKQLNLLELTRKSVDFDNPASRETLAQKIDKTSEKISGMDFDNEKDVEEQDAVMTVLNGEKKKYKDVDSSAEVIQKAAEKMAKAAEELGKKKKNKRDDDNFKMEYDTDGNPIGVESAWQVSPDYAAEAMKFMDSSLRWQSYTPPEWFKKMDGETQARIEYMMVVNSAAAKLVYAGKDLDKVLGNDSAFGFTNEQMTMLFNEDFKLVTSKMLNDLCEIGTKTTDQNGFQCLRYKEKYYQLDKNEPDGFAYDKPSGDPNRKRVLLDDTPENRGKGAWTIDKDVMDKVQNIMDYKDKLAAFLAGQNGRSKANYMDRMNAYTAYNLVFAMGDTSVWDRMRILPTYTGVISDAIRTLNPEYKALAKWQILKSGRIKENSSLFDAEYFSGPLADWALTVMKLERDLGKDGKDNPIDGSKSFRKKVIDGDVSILSNKTFYGFFDFVNGGRDLYKDPEGKENFYNKATRGDEVSLGKLVMDYASFDKNGNLIEKNGKDFNFGHRTVTFMNEFRDSLEGASLAYNCTMGKVDVKDPAVWARNLKDKLGMVNGIEFNGKRAFNYTRNLNFWRDAIIGSFGYDKERISSDHPYIKVQQNKNGISPSYNKELYHLLVDTFNLSNNDLNINKLMQLLGVNVADGENPNSFLVTTRNNAIEIREKRETKSLLEKQKKSFEYGKKTDTMSGLIQKVSQFNQYNGNREFDRLKNDFKKATELGVGSERYAEDLAKAIENFRP